MKRSLKILMQIRKKVSEVENLTRTVIGDLTDLCDCVSNLYG